MLTGLIVGTASTLVTILIMSIFSVSKTRKMETNADRATKDLLDSVTKSEALGKKADSYAALNERQKTEIDVLTEANSNLLDANEELHKVWNRFPTADEIGTKEIADLTGESTREVRKNLTSGHWTGRKAYDEDRMTWVMRKQDAINAALVATPEEVNG
jgi:hypothetical protein